MHDFFDGDLYHQFHIGQLKLFQDHHDVALQLSVDGVQVTNKHNHEIISVIFINLNLPPNQHYKVQNIMASTIIPRPKKPKNIDTFLHPMVDELKQLNTGIDCYDAATDSDFTLRAWVTIATGDGPAVADIMGFKRPGNAYRPCCHCLIKGVLSSSSRTYYVPHTHYNFTQPRLRPDNLQDVIYKLAEADSDEYYK
jgi:hypothetical protein